MRAAAAVLRLWSAEIAPDADDPAAVRFAVQQLLLSRDEALSTRDLPEFGCWTMAAAELAAYRGDPETACSLWAVALRLGTRFVYPFQNGYGPQLAAALDGIEGPDALLEGWRQQSMPVIMARVRDLLTPLLRA
jgi:hypothetical protein